MYESGYYENTQTEESTVVVSCGTFEFLSERDGSLLLSSIQTQLPFASGLWYWSPDQQRKKAVKYDRTTSKMFPPPQGWGDRTYYVSLLDNPHAGCVSGFGLDRYERATRLFQESVHSVSRLIGYEYSSTNPTERDTLQQFKKITDGAPTDSDALTVMQKKYDALSQQLRSKTDELIQSEETENQMQKQLQEANRKIAELENTLKAIESCDLEKNEQMENSHRKIAELENELAENVKRINVPFDSTEVQNDYSAMLFEKENEMAEKDIEIQNLIRVLEDSRKEVADLKMRQSLDNAVKMEPELSSYRKIIDDTKMRCQELDNAVDSSVKEIEYLNQRNRDIENDSCHLREELENCKNRCKQLEETVHALHQFSLHVKKQADDAKWRCGELENALKTNNVHFIDELNLKQLNDAKWKCGELEAALKGKQDEVNNLIAVKHELEAQLLIHGKTERSAPLTKEDDLPQQRHTDDLMIELASVHHQLVLAEESLTSKEQALSEGDGKSTVRNLNAKLIAAEQKYTDLYNEMEKALYAEKENSKWRQYELETSIAILKKELEENQALAYQREDELLKEIDQKAKKIEDLQEIIQ